MASVRNSKKSENSPHSRTKVTIDAIRAVLRNIEDPDLKQDIVSAGFIKKLTLNAGNVDLHLELTTPACPFKEQFKREASTWIQTLAGVKNVTVTLGSSRTKKENLQADSGLNTVDSVIAVASCKGGVGKSTVAALLACELVERGYAVGLLDADIFGPSLPTLFSLTIHGVKTQQKHLLPVAIPIPSLPSSLEVQARTRSPNAPAAKQHILKVMSFGLLLGDAPAVMRGAMVSNYITQVLHRVAWGQLDYLIIDLPPGTGDTILTLAQSTSLDGAVIVTTPATLSLVDVSRGMNMLTKVNVPLLGIIENMAYFTCNSCQTKHYIFERGKNNLNQQFGIETLVSLPLTTEKDKFTFAPYNIASRWKPLIGQLVDQTVRQLGKLKLAKQNVPQVTYAAGVLTLTFAPAASAASKPGTSQILKIPYKTLRLACPCALCKDEFSGKRKITVEHLPANLDIAAIDTVGNYALALTWSDGHSAGIYSYRFLTKLAATQPT